MKLFAYGSNMCLGRLQRRAPSARFLTVARLAGHDLRFHKTSSDGSAKADAYETGRLEDETWGVVFEIDPVDEARVDEAEGLGNGYLKRYVDVDTLDEQGMSASLYYAEQSSIDPDLKPYSWYLRFIIEGARQHGLSKEYLDRLDTVEVWEDPDRERDRRRRAISC
jgi:gamma-glutamylcyclotransferase